MTEETLFTAARRVVRFVRIDESHGGSLSIETLKTVETLDKELSREEQRLKASGAAVKIDQTP